MRKFHYNHETCQYEPIRLTPSRLVLRLFLFVGSALIMSVGFSYLYEDYYLKFREKSRLRIENEGLKFYYGKLESEMNALQEELLSLRERDDYVYRVIFESEPVPETVRKAGVGGSQRYKDPTDKD
ncbi:MAG: M23 family peptidase, partial [Cytophagales bacterium]|nr:M23 family peptidase [Cytophagales bacterium]